MSLANMRENGVACVAVSCICGRESSVDVSALAGALHVPALADRLRCSACGARPASVRPDWGKQVMRDTDPTRYLRKNPSP